MKSDTYLRTIGDILNSFNSEVTRYSGVPSVELGRTVNPYTGELATLHTRVLEAGSLGVLTAHIRDDYAPVGDSMIRTLVSSGEFITERWQDGWRVFYATN